MIERIIVLAQSFFSQYPHPTPVRSLDELPNTFLFRSGLCAFVWALDWISVGGPKGVKTERIRNDIVYVDFATFAPYFDGLLSMDERSQAVYQRAAIILEALTAEA